MNRPSGSSLLTDRLTALLRGENVSWSALGMASAEFIDACVNQDLTGLIYQRLCTNSGCHDWPNDVAEGLARHARAEAARELLRRKEIMSVLSALATDGIVPILLKGTPLAYTVYTAPHLRPRVDTDLLISRAQVDSVRRTLRQLRYSAALSCDGELLFCQFELGKEDEFGVDHALDFHWKISTQAIFADQLTYDELAAGAEAVPALGPHARTAGRLHALLLTCVHPVMHHRNVERLMWIYDIHLLASRLSTFELEEFVDLAIAKQVAAISAHSLSLAHLRFNTKIADNIAARLRAAPAAEPSAVYLRPARRWHHELVSNMRAMTRWGDRLQLLCEVLFPAPSYMLKAYGLRPRSFDVLLLPALYLHRGMQGAVKVLAGWK